LNTMHGTTKSKSEIQSQLRYYEVNRGGFSESALFNSLSSMYYVMCENIGTL
jgi:hypothetical protein